MSEVETVAVENARFGELRVPIEEILHFEGLPGFSDVRRFALLRHDRESTFLWLVCLDREDLSFVVCDPRLFFPDYAPAVGDVHLAAVGAKDTEGVELLSIATIREDSTTLNLAGPLLVNAAAGKGVQLILEKGKHSTQEPLPEV